MTIQMLKIQKLQMVEAERFLHDGGWDLSKDIS